MLNLNQTKNNCTTPAIDLLALKLHENKPNSYRGFSSNIRRATSVPVSTTVQETVEETNVLLPERSFLMRSPEPTGSGLVGPSPLQLIEERAQARIDEIGPENVPSVTTENLIFRHSLTDTNLSEQLRAVQERTQLMRTLDEIGSGAAEVQSNLESARQHSQQAAASLQRVNDIPLPETHRPISSTSFTEYTDWRDDPEFIQMWRGEDDLLALMEQTAHNTRTLETDIIQRQVESDAEMEQLTRSSGQRREENQAFFQNYDEETARSVERTTNFLRYTNLAVGIVTTAFALPFLHDFVRVGITIAREAGIVDRISMRLRPDNAPSLPAVPASRQSRDTSNVPNILSNEPPAASTGVFRGDNTDISDWSSPPQK